MRAKLNHEVIDSLVSEGRSYKEIVEITGYNKNSVYGYCIKRYGKLVDRAKIRRQVIPITQEQKEFLFGTLMGDGHLQLVGKNSSTVMGRTNHCIKQEEYCKHKRNVLNELAYDVKFCIRIANNKEYKQCYYCMKPNTELLPIYNLFYKDKKKDVPEDLSLLTPKALAWWFMDDGTASGRCSISIATCSFSLNGLIRLKNYLKQIYDLDVTIQKDSKLYFSAYSGKKFYELVKDFIIPSMTYKFKYLLM